MPNPVPTVLAPVETWASLIWNKSFGLFFGASYEAQADWNVSADVYCDER